MAYRIVKDRRAWWPVSWPGVDDEGAIVTNEIEMRFRLMKVDEAFGIATAVDGTRIDETDPEAGRRQVQAWTALVLRMADDWRGVLAENGDPIPFNDANVALLMNEPTLFSHVFDAFRDAMNARERLREGN